MEAVILVLAVAVLWAFSKTPYADEPVELHNASMEPSSGTKALLSLVIGGVMLFTLAALVGGGSLDTPTYADARAAGDDAVTALAGTALLGCIGLLLLIHGIATKLALLIFLAGVVLSVMVMGGAGI